MMQLSCTVDLMSSQSQLLLLLSRRGVVAVVNAVAIAVVFHLHCGRRGDAISQSPQVLRRRFKHDRRPHELRPPKAYVPATTTRPISLGIRKHYPGRSYRNARRQVLDRQKRQPMADTKMACDGSGSPRPAKRLKLDENTETVSDVSRKPSDDLLTST